MRIEKRKRQIAAVYPPYLACMIHDFLSNKPSKDAKTIHNITRVKSNSKRQFVCFQNPYFQTCLTNDNLFAFFLVGYNNIDCIHGWETGWLQNPAPVGRW
jgi:hypothetical protein